MDANVKAILLAGTFVPSQLTHVVYHGPAAAYHAPTVLPLQRFGLVSLEAGYQAVARQIARHDDGGPLVLLGHSQGGLHAVRYAWTHANVIAVVTWATPHHGTLVARPFARLAPALRDMCPGSAYLEWYAHDCLTAVADRIWSVYACDDLVIRPYGSPYVPGAHNLLVTTPARFAALGAPPDVRLVPAGHRWTDYLTHITGLFGRLDPAELGRLPS